jgi:hypothetical protein
MTYSIMANKVIDVPLFALYPAVLEQVAKVALNWIKGASGMDVLR